MSYRLLLVGCGNMGRALLKGWQARQLLSEVYIVEPSAAIPDDNVVSAPDQIPAGFHPDIIVLAVKPQQLEDALPAYKKYGGHSVFLSIAAGKNLSFFSNALGTDTAIIRAMPNTPAMIGQGMSVCCALPTVSAAQRTMAETLLQAVGHVAWIDDESLMDAVTALSGSGPAYVFLMIEAMAAAGVQLGLGESLALTLAKATVAGAGALAQQSDEPPALLRDRVTSKGGTTAAALSVLMDSPGLVDLMLAAMQAAASRSRELG